MKSLLQTPEWASFKEKQGWRIHRVDDIYVLEKPLPLGKSFLYSPEVEWSELHGHPEASAEGSLGSSKLSHSRQILRDAQNDNLQIFLQNLQKNIKKSETIFFRLEILDEYQPEIIDKLKKFGFIKAFEEIQPEWRQIIDISKSEEEILAQMKPKGRYNIKVAQKHGVETTVCPIDRLNDGIEVFYDLYRQTTHYQKITLRDKKYFLEMMKILYSKHEAAVIIARYQNVPLAVIIITFYDKVASYLYGGTSRLHKNVMAPCAAHWEAIKLAKEKGCETYDLLAIAPPSEEMRNEKCEMRDHKYSGITQFKEQFGGRKIHLIGSWDLVYRPGWYRMFKMVEKFRRK